VPARGREQRQVADVVEVRVRQEDMRDVRGPKTVLA
jgi:hypothetical protein